MSTTDPSFSWGAETLGRLSDEPSHTRDSARSPSLLGARMAAVIIDGFVLLVPVFGIAYLMSLAFPNHGFFVARSGTATATSLTGSSSTRFTYTLPLPGALLVTALSLSYFFVFEALRGQTVGKRRMGLRVQSASGGVAGLNAISGRTVLRLIDGIGFYLVGWLVALLSGSRRRRIGDWVGGTVVVRDDGTLENPHRHDAWRLAVFPGVWVLAVLLGVFALGLGTAVGEDERAVALVQSYVKAREQGNASLACSMLSSAQQREIVAIETNDYADASASRCPAYILRSEPNSHLLNPGLAQLAASPLSAAYSPLGAVVIYSPQYPSLRLVAISEEGHLELDMRGFEKVEFDRGCAADGQLTAAECSCTFDLARAQKALPESDSGLTPEVISALAADRARCESNSSATDS